MTATREIVTDKREQFAFHDDIAYLAETKRGLTRATIEEISGIKEEPEWMLQYRLRAFDHFQKRAMPTWTDGLDKIDFDKIVYNLVTKRAHAYENSTVEWIDANTGSRKTVKFPAIYLRGEGATADIISVAVAGKGQHQDTGAKAIHLAPNTRSRIVSKSVSKDGGRATYRGQLKVSPGATNVVASVRCDALMLDDISRSDTYPYIDIGEDDTSMTHEATVGKVSQDQVFYLMSRGLTENEATNLIVQGFLEVFTKELPMEYAIEFNRLVKLEMEGSLG